MLSPGFRIAASAMASSSGGKAIIRSVKRMMAAPHQPAQIAGDEAQRGAHRHGEAIGHDADQQRGLRAEEQAGELVAAVGVGAEPEARIGRQGRALERQAVEELLRRIVRRQPGRCRGGKHEDDDDHQAGHGQPVTAEAVPSVVHAKLNSGTEREARLSRGRPVAARKTRPSSITACS